MTAWRNVFVSGFIGTCLLAGCTVTTGNATDGGVFIEDTGGTSGTGGSTSTVGGSGTTGGTTSAGTTVVVQCTANFDDNAQPACGDPGETTSCDSCLQTHECNAEYKACYQTGCMTLISNVAQCMVDAFVSSSTGVLPDGAEATCLATYGLDSPTTADAVNAKALWKVIGESLYCNEVCCAIITQH